MNNFDLKLSKLSKFLLFSIPILPLLFIDGFFYPFVLGRTIFFRAIILLALAIQAYLFFKKSNFQFIRNKSLIIFGILVTWYLVSAIFGLDFFKSFFSTFERFEGVVLWIFLWVYLGLLQVNFKKIEDWYNYFRVIVLASALVSIYALIQKFAILNVFNAGIDRAAGTLDNAAFLGAYILLVLPLVCILSIKDQNWKRWLWLGIGILNIGVLYLTYTRSALLGLLVAMVVFVFTYLWNKGSRYRGLSIGLVVLLFASVFFVRSFFAGSDNFLVNRFVNVFQDSSVQNRLLVWERSLAIAPEHILTGVGWENFDIVYNKFYTPEINEQWFDRAHNTLVDVLIMTGLLGLILYLLWYGVFLFKAYQLRKEDYFTGLILFSFLVGYFVNNLFLFETINTAFIVIAFFGFVFFNKDNIETGANINLPVILRKFFNYLLLPLLTISLFYYLVFLPTNINRKLFTGYSALFTNKDKAFVDFSYASKHDFAINEVSKQLHDSYQSLIDINASPENKIKFFKLAEEKLWKANDVYPWDIRINLYLGQLIVNSYNKQEDVIKAENLLLKAKEFSPKRPEVYYLLGQVYIRLGEEEKSIAIIEELEKQLPDLADVKFTLANLYWYTDKEKAKNIFERGINLPYVKDTDNYERIISYLLNAQEYSRVLPYLIAFVEMQPQEYKYRLDLSRVYYLNGDVESAIEQIRVVQANAPDLLKDQADYLKMLNINFEDN